MKNIFDKKSLLRLGLITVGALIMTIVTQELFDPAGIVTGGFSGLAIILKEISGGRIPLWLTMAVLNTPLFILSFILKGWKYISRTVLATVLFTFFLGVIPVFHIFDQSDLFIRMLIGSVLYGFALGLIFYADATTGGTDTMADLLHLKIKQYSLAQIMQVLDGIIVAAGLVTFGINEAMYSLVAVVIIAKVSDAVLEGSHYAKAVYIISDKYQEIADAILSDVERGVTGISAQGMYTGSEKKMLFAAVSKKQLVPVKELIYSIDRNAFVIITDAREVLGDGFLELK